MRAPVELPQFISGKDIIIASSYRKNLIDVRRASHEFLKLGLTVYPNHDQKQTIMDGDFVFMGGEHKLGKLKVQRSFFEAVRQARLLYVVTSNGYLGQTASVETSYGLAAGIPTFLSEPITNFGEGVLDEITQILQSHPIPTLPIDNIAELGRNGFLNNEGLSHLMPLNKLERRKLFFAMVSVIRTLR